MNCWCSLLCAGLVLGVWGFLHSTLVSLREGPMYFSLRCGPLPTFLPLLLTAAKFCLVFVIDLEWNFSSPPPVVGNLCLILVDDHGPNMVLCFSSRIVFFIPQFPPCLGQQSLLPVPQDWRFCFAHEKNLRKCLAFSARTPCLPIISYIPVTTPLSFMTIP